MPPHGNAINLGSELRARAIERLRLADGLQGRDLSPDELRHVRCADIGISQELIDQWIKTDGLKASFEAPSGPKPPPIVRVPPSRR